MSVVSKNSTKQNPSGHITMNNQEAMFFAECNKKLNRINNQRDAGLLPQQQRRNPLLAEQSPRYPGFKFDFSVPEKKPDPQKWVYPENDWGLMAKFVSQKPIFDEIRQKEENYAQIRKEFKAIRKRNEQVYHDELVREMEKKNEVDDPDVEYRNSKKVHRIHRHPSEVLSTLNPDDEHLLQDIHDHKSHSRHKNYRMGSRPKEVDLMKVDFFDQKISRIKDLNATHPDVLAKWRADRAAEFVSQGGEKYINPPPPRILSTMPFHPGGQREVKKEALSGVKKMRKTASSTALVAAPPPSIEAMQATMDSLKAQLSQTNEELDRQKLLIAFNKREKGFEKMRQATTTARNGH